MARLDRAAKRAALLASPLFSAIGQDVLDQIVDLIGERSFARSQVIFQRDDAGDAIMAVVRGRVRISTMSPDGREIILNMINPGEVFGEIAVLDGKRRSADATAAEETTLLILESRHFLPFLDANPAMLRRLLAVLCDRLRRTSVAMENLALMEVPERLARLLLKLAGDYGRQTGAGMRIDLKLSQKDIGNLVGSSREGVNKQLRLWQAAGSLDRQRGYIVLLRPRDLERLLTQRPSLSPTNLSPTNLSPTSLSPTNLSPTSLSLK